MLTKRNIEKHKSESLQTSDDDTHLSAHLSNERTFLSWTRTGLNIFTVGCAIGRFGGSNSSSSASLSDPKAEKKPLIAGIILAIIGILCLIYGISRFFRVYRKIKHKNLAKSPDIFGPILSVLILVGALIAVLILFFII